MQNKYLKRILKSLGVTVNGNKSNNYLLKKIAENTGNNKITGVKTDNYLLKTIAENTENNSSSLNEANATIAELTNQVAEYQYKSENYIVFKSDDNIVQKDDSLDLAVIAVVDGERSSGNNVYFYEVEV